MGMSPKSSAHTLPIANLCHDNGFNVITMSDFGYDLNSQSIVVQDENR